MCHLIYTLSWQDVVSFLVLLQSPLNRSRKSFWLWVTTWVQPVMHASVGQSPYWDPEAAGGVSSHRGGHTGSRIPHACYLFAKCIKMFVLDEAEEMLSRGFKDQIYEIFQKQSTNIQVVLLSATMPAEVLEVTKKFASWWRKKNLPSRVSSSST